MGRFVYLVGGATAVVNARGALGGVLEAGTLPAHVHVQGEVVLDGAARQVHGLLVGEGVGELRLEDVREWGEWEGESKVESRKAEVLFGVIGEGMPGPGDLARGRQVDGHWVELGDGHKWLVPCARRFPSGTMLPQSLIMERGVRVGGVVREYVEFSKRAEGLFERLYLGKGSDREDAGGVSFGEAFAICVEALGVNYRVGAAEVSRLELLRTDRLRSVLGAIVDEPSFATRAAELGMQRWPTLGEGAAAHA